MEGKDVLKVVQSLKKKKEEKILAKTAKDDQIREGKEIFYRCKDHCVCGKSKCEAAGLKECSNCHNILRSVCGRAACKIDGKCPQMIFPASHKPPKRKLVLGDSSDEEEDEADSDSSDSDSFKDLEDSDDRMEDEDGDEDEDTWKNTLKKTWCVISPPNKEADIVGKWFAVIYDGKKRVYIAFYCQSR